MTSSRTQRKLSAFDNLRGWLAHLAATNRLALTRENVALEYELAAIAKRLDGEKAVLFPNPGDRERIPVISGFMSARPWVAEALGVDEDELLTRYREAAEKPLEWNEVTRKHAPVQTIEHRQDIDVRALLPIPTHSEHDSGPYITAGLVIARNPATGVQNVSINRIQVNSANRLAALILPRHLHAYQQAAEQQGQSLDVAVVIGVDPLTLLASQAMVPIDHDELEIAGALHGKPLDVVKCLTNDVRVPAHAEIVLEGHIPAHEREAEGPFGEFPKYYSAQAEREVIDIDCVTHRKKPLYHTIIPAEMEHLLLGGIAREATLLGYLQRSFPGVLDVHLAVGGVCRYHLYVKLEKRREGEPKNLIMAAFGAHYDIKHVVVVDEDVNVHNPQDVEWAVSTRFQADRDLVVISGALGSQLDPSTTVNEFMGDDFQGISAKMGLDATRPLHYEGFVFTRVRIPGEDQVDLSSSLQVADEERLQRYILP